METRRAQWILHPTARQRALRRYVRQLVAARGLPPDPASSPESWPWPLRIHALGRFEVLRDGTPLAFRGKAQKKPLELLKALVALGGEGVETGRLAAILWPDAAMGAI